MRVWRIYRKPYVDNALDGIGGMYTSGRWHLKGNPIVDTEVGRGIRPEPRGLVCLLRTADRRGIEGGLGAPGRLRPR
jgi:hypothetical protein